MSATVNRRDFVITSSAALLTRFGNSRQETEKKQPEVTWFDPATWGVEGRGFDDTKKYFDRLPARAEQSVRERVWELSRFSSGMSVRFKTDSPDIHVKYKLTDARLAMPHMPATSVSGVDLYAADENGMWRWVSVVKPDKPVIQARIAANLTQPENGLREFMVYLPLFNGLKEFEIGVGPGSQFEPVAPRTEKPIVFYGTSIMHGACASRSGMSISAIVGRRLNRPTINLGFSGNGRMEEAVGDFLIELDPCVYAIDCLPNMGPQNVRERCEPLVHQIRAARPDAPILLVEDRINTGAWIRNGQLNRHADNRAALKSAYDKLLADGVKGLHYLTGETLLGSDGEAATDGSHPSDLGMVRYADAYEQALQGIL